MHGAAGFCHSNFSACRQDRSKPPREMVGEIPGLFARIARLERQYRERRTLGWQRTSLATGKESDTQSETGQGRTDDPPFPELFVDILQVHTATSLLISIRRA